MTSFCPQFECKHDSVKTTWLNHRTIRTRPAGVKLYAKFQGRIYRGWLGWLVPPGATAYCYYCYACDSQTLKFHSPISPDPLNARSLRSLGFPKSPPLKTPRSDNEFVVPVFTRQVLYEDIQEAQLSPRDRAMRRVNWNLANCHATVQKLLIRQVLTNSMVWSWRFRRRQCVIDNVHSTMTRSSRLLLSQVS